MQGIKMIMDEYKKTKNFKKMGGDAKELLEREGLTQLPQGSFWTWVHIDWLNKALEEKVLAENIYGQFIPVADVLVIDEVVGKRGPTNITKKVEKLSFSRFLDFADRYSKFCYAKDMELQQRIPESRSTLAF